MLGTETLMARAFRYVLDKNNIHVETYKAWPTNLQLQLQDLVIDIADDMRYQQLKYFRPFEHQLTFFKTGASERRGILAANRIGKTVSTCYETAYHLTGQYPDWWEGYRFDRPITCMVAGEGWSQVALVLQNELLGTQDVKITDNLGTGAVPRDCIIVDTMRNDGANCIGVEIRHAKGGNSYLLFANYTRSSSTTGFQIEPCCV